MSKTTHAFIQLLDEGGRIRIKVRWSDRTQFITEQTFANQKEAMAFLSNWCKENGIKLSIGVKP